jgi:hypothetical protein
VSECLKVYGWTKLQLICNSLHVGSVRYYALVRKSPRPTKLNPNNFVYVIDLHIPEHNSILHFTPGGEIELDWSDKN